MFNAEAYEVDKPSLYKMMDLLEGVKEDDKSQLRSLFENAGMLIINRPHKLDKAFLEKVVDFLISYHREFRGVFEDEFFAKAIARIFSSWSEELANELEQSLLYAESKAEKISYMNLLLMKNVGPSDFIGSYNSFYKNLHTEKKLDQDNFRDFRNFIETIVIALSYVNRVDESKITTPIGLVVKNIQDRLNESDGDDPILVEIYTSMTDPSLTTGKFNVSQEVLDVMKETPTDPIHEDNISDMVRETRVDDFTTDPDIAGEAKQKMHLLISLEKLIAQTQEFYFTTWLSLSNQEIKVCYVNYEKSLKALEACWDWQQWQLKEGFDLRNLAFVYQEALTGFNECLKDLVSIKSDAGFSRKENNGITTQYIGVSMRTYDNLIESKEDADRLGIVLSEVEESLPPTTLSYFEGKIVQIVSNFDGKIEDPRAWSFEVDTKDINDELATADIDRNSLVELLQRDRIK